MIIARQQQNLAKPPIRTQRGDIATKVDPTGIMELYSDTKPSGTCPITSVIALNSTMPMAKKLSPHKPEISVFPGNPVRDMPSNPFDLLNFTAPETTGPRKRKRSRTVPEQPAPKLKQQKLLPPTDSPITTKRVRHRSVKGQSVQKLTQPTLQFPSGPHVSAKESHVTLEITKTVLTTPTKAQSPPVAMCITLTPPTPTWARSPSIAAVITHTPSTPTRAPSSPAANIDNEDIPIGHRPTPAGGESPRHHVQSRIPPRRLLNSRPRLRRHTVVEDSEDEPTLDTVKVPPAIPAPILPPAQAPITLPPWLHKVIPDAMRSDITGFTDVAPDGNCGFRAIAVALGRPQSDWMRVRSEMAQTMLEHKTTFASIFGTSGATRLYNAINWTRDAPAPKSHWLEVPDMLAVAAQTYQRPAAVFAPGGQSNTWFPLGVEVNDHEAIVLGFVGGNHFVRVEMREGGRLPAGNIQWEAQRGMGG